MEEKKVDLIQPPVSEDTKVTSEFQIYSKKKLNVGLIVSLVFFSISFVSFVVILAIYFLPK